MHMNLGNGSSLMDVIVQDWQWWGNVGRNDGQHQHESQKDEYLLYLLD